MGSDKVTLKKVTVLDVDQANGIILIKGAVAGKRGTLVTIRG
jgi:ribosomal protein L3